jgi:RimJ/RimL family protein N-acetyltransferase
VVLQNEILLLRPWQFQDARWYVEARDEEIYQWTTEPRTLTIHQVEAAIEEVNASDRIASFAIVDPASNQLMGNIALVLEEENRHSGEVMYWLAPAGRGRGLASQAVTLVCQWAFARLGLEQVTLQTHRDNLRSQRVAERAGFRRVADPQEKANQPEPIWYVLTSSAP